MANIKDVWWPTPVNDTAVNEERQKNKVYYRVEATEPYVEFVYEYPGIGTLCDKNGKPYTISGDVKISAEFNYWDEGNECPPIQEDYFPDGYAQWKAGGIFAYGTSGMDFVLTGKTEVTLEHVAVEITKYVVGYDEDGKEIRLSPKEDINNISFDLYEKQGDHAEFINLNVGRYSRDPDYNSGYVPVKTEYLDVSGEGTGHFHDYRNIEPGIIYIEEKKDTIPDVIEDKDGNLWKYKETKFETEYVWRENGDENKARHVSKTYTKADARLRSIPEVLGNYQHNGSEWFNEFLEFYVWNVYEKVESKKQETLIKHGDAKITPELDATHEAAGAHGKDIEVYNGVQVGDQITYEISFENYRAEAADVTITDVLDENVKFILAEGASKGTQTQITKPTEAAGGQVTWVVEGVPAGQKDNVTLTVEVLEGAKTPGKVDNQASVQVNNDTEVWTNIEENPVPEEPKKVETEIGHAGKTTAAELESTQAGAAKNGGKDLEIYNGVQVGDQITYEIRFKNYKSQPANVTIEDVLDANVKYVVAGKSDVGTDTKITAPTEAAGGKVTWVVEGVPANTAGKVTLTVEVLEGAKTPGKVDNQATVQVANDNAFWTNEEENPVPEEPHKKEVKPYEGTGLLGFVRVGDVITYEINFRNYKEKEATVTVKDKLDANVEYAGSEPEGAYDKKTHTVTWTLEKVAKGAEGKVTLKVKVLKGALKSEGGTGSVINGGDTATVKVDNDSEYTLNTVENPLPEKQEVKPYEGTGVLGAVQVGDEITYQISYLNYKTEAADVVIKDKLDANVEYAGSEPEGAYDKKTHTVTWTLEKVAKGAEGKVTLKVKVLKGALKSEGGTGSVINGGDTATVKVDNDSEYTLNTVENPLPEKQEVKPYEGTGVLGAVQVGDEITYQISYLNYKTEAADVVIKDKLDANVAFISASDDGVHSKGTVTWTLKGVKPGKAGTVTLVVKVLEGALVSGGGPGNVVNGGDTATVKVGNDAEYALYPVENPAPEIPHKKEIVPYEGIGVLGDVKVGDEITYEISYKNYKTEAADVVIKDKLDANVEFVSASDSGVNNEGTVEWTLKDVKPGKAGTVTLVVKVLKGALVSNGGPGKVVNGGETATVKVGNDNEFTLEVVENPVPEEPQKREIEPYTGVGVLGAVQVGDEITYEISYRNYKTEAANVVIKDKLDVNVEFVSASDKGVNNKGTVEWTLKSVKAGASGKVTLKVKVLAGALVSEGGPGKVVNGGKTATVQVGNDNEFTLEVVENPVPEEPQKREIAPYTGVGLLGAVKVVDEITYEIRYINYKSEAADVVIKDKLDKNVEFVSASDGGANNGGTVVWTLKDVAAGKSGTVTLKVKVLEGALVSNGGTGSVVNGGDTATVKVGNDAEVTLNTVENPVPEEPHKQEVAPYEGIGVLGDVKVGDEITYEISYRNYKDRAVDVKIKDRLDANVVFVSASDGGRNRKGVVSWTLKDVPAGKTGTVTLTVKVLEGALKSNGGPGKVVNGGETATVQVGNDAEYTLDVVENPVDELHRDITGEVWLDEDYDGDDDDDHPLEDITVILRDEDGNEVDRTTTDEDGHYTFKDVEPGDYTIEFEDDRPVTVQNDKPEKGKSIADKLHTIDKVHVPTDKEIIDEDYEHGVFDEKTGTYTLTDQNMGVVEYTRAITGIAFLDEDKNGEYGKGDMLMPGETVYLYRIGKDGKIGDKPVATTRTDKNGFYSFEGLEGGNYAVVFGVDLDELAVTVRKDTDNGSKIDLNQMIRNIYLPTDDEIAANADYRRALDENGCYRIEHMNAGYIHAPAPTATPKPTAVPNNNNAGPGVTPKPTVTITGTKVWDDDGNARGLRPESVTVRLLADGTPVDADPTWTGTDTDVWTYTFRAQPAVTDDGIEINYTVQEEPVRYYEAEVSGTTITNHLVPENPKGYVDLSGVKNWIDNNDAQGKRPSEITLRLLRNGEAVQTLKVTAEDEWKYSFDHLPTDDGLGVDYAYELREDGVPGYFARIDGANVTNTLQLDEQPQGDGGDTPKGVTLDNRNTGTPLPGFGQLTEAELEELYDVFGYGTPLWGILPTGDETPAWPYAFAVAGALALLALVLMKRKRRE